MNAVRTSAGLSRHAGAGLTLAPSPAAVVTSALTKRFDERLAVDAVDVRIESGAFFGLIGSNGAGKTTLVKMLTTLLPPTSGSAQVAGFDTMRETRQVRRRIGHVPQLYGIDARVKHGVVSAGVEPSDQGADAGL